MKLNGHSGAANGDQAALGTATTGLTETKLTGLHINLYVLYRRNFEYVDYLVDGLSGKLSEGENSWLLVSLAKSL